MGPRDFYTAQRALPVGSQPQPKVIAFLEAFGKKVVIHTNSDRLGIKQDTISGYSLSGLLSLIDHASFVQCHKSYIVNKSHIEKIHKSEKRIFLKGFETPVPIGNKYQAGLRG